MNRAFLVPLLLMIATASGVAYIVGNNVKDYANDLSYWRENAKISPEGTATAELFQRAVEADVITWNGASRTVQIRRDVKMSDRLSHDLFRVKEAGSVIAAELRRAEALSQSIGIRVRRDGCQGACLKTITWDLYSTNATSEAQSLARAVSSLSSQNAGEPVPRLNAVLSGKGGFEPWQVWASTNELKFKSVDIKNIDTIDVLGKLAQVPDGWSVIEFWCRNDRGQLIKCANANDAVAWRMHRDSLDKTEVDLVVSPVNSLPSQPPVGKHALTDRLRLNCNKQGRCVPFWNAVDGLRRYARANKNDDKAKTSRPPLEIAIFDKWVDQVEGDIVPSKLATDNGALMILGGNNPRPGSLLAAIKEIPYETKAKITIHPEIQKITNDVVSEFTDDGGPVNYPIPNGGRRMSIVVLDLKPDSIGAIRGVAGTPQIPESMSNWDIAALPFKRGSVFAPGPTAWTGRGWHHIPGSTWKLFTAITLIDAINDPDLGLQARSNLRKAMTGLRNRDANAVFGDNVWSGQRGICVPIQMIDGLRGTNREGCGPGYHASINDSGRGGPLKSDDAASFGLAEAIAISSNIWFVSSLLYAEDSQADDKAILVKKTAERLGLLSPAPLDSGLGLSLDLRDPINVEAISSVDDTQALALTAFGQRTQAGPLILAQLSASLATNRDVRPTLLEPIQAVSPLFKDASSISLLGIIQKGMRAVVSGDAIGSRNWRGTGRKAFAARARGIQKRAGGKTGTASRGIGLDRISSFTGWLDDKENKPAYAFGCSAAVKGQRRGGGVSVPQICAHAIAEIMNRIDRKVLAK